MINIEVNNDIISLVKDAIDTKITEMKSSLYSEVSNTDNTTIGINNMDMTTITKLVSDINNLNEVSDQINIKTQFQQ